MAGIFHVELATLIVCVPIYVEAYFVELSVSTCVERDARDFALAYDLNQMELRDTPHYSWYSNSNEVPGIHGYNKFYSQTSTACHRLVKTSAWQHFLKNITKQYVICRNHLWGFF